MKILEFLSVTTVVTNSALIYVTSDEFFKTFNTVFDLDSTTIFWIILAVEHFLFLLKIFFQGIINDRPSWVLKSLKNFEKVQEKFKI